MLRNPLATQRSTSSIKAIIFDHDGTLVDSEGVHCHCWNQTIMEYIAKPPSTSTPLSFNAYCQNYNGLPTLETAQRIRQAFNLNASTQALYNNKIAKLNAHLARQPFPLLAHVIGTLEWLKERNIPLAVASGANRHEVIRSLKAHNLEHFFASVSTKQDVAFSKPAPDVYLLAAQQLGVAPVHCLAIEDSDTGQASASQAGMTCLRLTPKPSGPLEFTDMGSILTWLKQSDSGLK